MRRIENSTPGTALVDGVLCVILGLVAILVAVFLLNRHFAAAPFGNELIKEVFDSLFLEDTSKMIERGSETDLNGSLMPNYSYLEDYLAGK